MSNHRRNTLWSVRQGGDNHHILHIILTRGCTEGALLTPPRGGPHQSVTMTLSFSTTTSRSQEWLWTFPRKRWLGIWVDTNSYACPLPLCTLLWSLFLDRDFILKRQRDLQDYINGILENSELSSNINTQRFFDPENFMISFQGLRIS